MLPKFLYKNNLLFSDEDVTAENFTSGQVCVTKKGYIAYRWIVTLVTASLLIVHISTYTNPATFLFYLTHWAEIFLNIYLILALVNVILRYSQTENGRNSWLVCHDSKTVLEVKYIPPQECIITVEDTSLNGIKDKKQLNGLEKMIWCMYEITYCTCLTVTIIFWALLFHFYFDTHKITEFKTFHIIYGHCGTFGLILMETITSRHPTKFLHFLYTYFSGVFYVLYTLLLHVLRTNYPNTHDVIPEHIYWFTDWTESYIIPTLLCILMFPVTILMQSSLILIHYLRNKYCCWAK